MVQHALHAPVLAAVGGDQVHEVGVPAHAAHGMAQRDELSLGRGVDVRTDLVDRIRARARVDEVDVRRGLAERPPHGAQLCGVMVEVGGVRLAEAGDDARVRVKPVEDRAHVAWIHRLGADHAVGIPAILAVDADDAVEFDPQCVQHDRRLRGRAAGADEGLHAMRAQGVKGIDCGLGHSVRREARECAVDVEERRADVGGGRIWCSGHGCHCSARGGVGSFGPAVAPPSIGHYVR